MDSKPMYETVALNEDHEEALSSTEVEESLMGDEKQWHSQRRSRRRSCMDKIKSYRWMIDTFLLLVIIALLVLLRQEWADQAFPKSSYQVGGDWSGAGPHFEKKIVKWEQNEAFTPMDGPEWFSNDTLATWNTLMPVVEGSGWGTPGQTYFTTSMTHQLHCLFMMGRIFSGVVMNTTGSLPEHSLPHDWHFHFMHCIDYLRQAVMCAGDVAAEPHEPDESGDSEQLGPLDGGWNGHHVCKDYSQVIHYLEGQVSDKARVILPIDD